MLTEEKALYQTKLIIDYLPMEEYNLIPRETLDYIEDNFEYDKDINVDPSIPLEEQNIDIKTYKILDRIIRETEISKSNENITNGEDSENIRLTKLVDALQKENEKIPKIKELVEDYKDELNKKNDEIKELKENNQILFNAIQKIPKFIRRFFIKDNDIKLLGDGK